MRTYLLNILFFLAFFGFAQEKKISKGFELKKLNYSYDALEPNFDKQTMEIHHTKHHQGYVNNLNKALAGTNLEGKTLEEILIVAKNNSEAIRNNVGGVYNHNLFFDIISPKGGGKPKGELLEAIEKKYGSFEKFKEEFKKVALSRFGSGWTWLILENKELKIASTPNQDNPLMDNGKLSLIIGLDVWEHSYYLKYQNKRADYIDSFFNLIDWEKANQIFNKSK